MFVQPLALYVLCAGHGFLCIPAIRKLTELWLCRTKKKKKKSSGLECLILLSIVTAKSVKAWKESSQPSDLISTDTWRPQESWLPPHSNPSPRLSQGMLCLFIIFQQEAPPVHTSFPEHEANQQQWQQYLFTRRHRSVFLPILLLLWIGTNLKINFCSSLFCGLLPFLSHA